MNRALTLVVVSALLVVGQVSSPAAACACGAPAPRPGETVDVYSETAIVSWDGEVEEIIMRLALNADSGDTGLVVPTPTPATVTAGDLAMFEQLERLVTPEQVVEWDWWTWQWTDGSVGSAPPTVLDRVQLGPIEATTLAASDTIGLTGWLDENGYALDPAVSAELGPYVDAGWSFVALKLSGDERFEGELDPIRFSFESDRLVYPMQLSRAADSAQSVRLYVLGDHKVEASRTGAGQSTLAWSGPVNAFPDLGSYLTVLDFYFYDPATQIDGDIEFERSATDSSFTPVEKVQRTVTVAGIPAGPLAVLVSLVIIVFAAVAFGVRYLGRRLAD